LSDILYLVLTGNCTQDLEEKTLVCILGSLINLFILGLVIAYVYNYFIRK